VVLLNKRGYFHEWSTELFVEAVDVSTAICCCQTKDTLLGTKVNNNNNNLTCKVPVCAKRKIIKQKATVLSYLLLIIKRNNKYY